MSIQVYSAKWCQGCGTVKKVLEQKGIAYEVVDIDTVEGMEKAKELGVRNIPVTVVNGERFIGSSKQVLDMILESVGV